MTSRGSVIVSFLTPSTGIEAFDTVLDLTQGSQHQNGHAEVGFPDATGHRKTIEARQHPIQNQQIEGVGQCRIQRIRTITGDDDVVSEIAKPVPDETRRFNVILGNQDAHALKQSPLSSTLAAPDIQGLTDAARLPFPNLPGTRIPLVAIDWRNRSSL